MSALGLIGLCTLAGVSIAVLGMLSIRSVDKRLAGEDPGALFICRSNLWIDQAIYAPELSVAAERVRRRWVRFWFKGQLFGTVRLDGETIRWTPQRLTRRFGMEAWALPLDRITSVEVSSMPIGIGRGGVAVIYLPSGHLIDLTVNDRDQFKAAWKRATNPGSTLHAPRATLTSVKYVTRYERFVLGDFPLVCARSGLPATKLVPVQAWRSSLWPWLFFPGFAFLLASWVGDSDHPWGLLPVAEGNVQGVSATYEKRIGVILRGVHPEFVAATREAQGRAPRSW